jgi:sec-independent protein translocase protein TatA
VDEKPAYEVAIMMPGLPELLVILVIVFVVFGAGKLPQVFGAVGEGLKNFREASQAPSKEQDVTPVAKQIPGRAAVEEAELVQKEKSDS